MDNHSPTASSLPPTLRLVIRNDNALLPEEARQIPLLYHRCFRSDLPLTQEDYDLLWNYLTRSGMFRWYCLWLGDQLVGMAAVITHFDQAYLTDLNLEYGENLCNVAIHPDYRRHGYARWMLQELANDYLRYRRRPQDPLVLGVQYRNPMFSVLRKFYGSLGFDEIGKNQKSLYMRLRES